jgi:hypothetical protein
VEATWTWDVYDHASMRVLDGGLSITKHSENPDYRWR